VTKGTRPKKPSSSRSFAHEAHGALGSWGLKTKNGDFFSLFNYQKPKIYFIFIFIFKRPCKREIASVRTQPVRADARDEGRVRARGRLNR
jgi:hypothetical protein